MNFFEKGSLILAPMSGFTDSPFRLMCRRYGANVCVSEFAHSRAVLSGAQKVIDKLRFDDLERPYGIQIFGANPSEMADAASFIEDELKPDFLDINYGCPAPNAVDAGAGSALLKDPKKMAEIARCVAARLKKIPLTAKMRTGWGAETILPDTAKMLEQNGVKMLAIHGRSKKQAYSGESNWALIEKTAESLSIPVIGNGSVEKLSAEQLRSSACSGFMVGRAAVGNPWIFEEIKCRLSGSAFVAPKGIDRICAAVAYLDEVSGKRSDFNIINYRPNILAFVRGFAGFKKLRAAMAQTKTASEVKEILKDFDL